MARSADTRIADEGWRRVDESSIERRSGRSFSFTDGATCVRIDLGVVDGRWEPIRIDLRSYGLGQEGPIRPLRVRTIRHTPLGNLVSRAGDELGEQLATELTRLSKKGVKETYRDREGRWRASFDAAGARRGLELLDRPRRRPGRPRLEDTFDLQQVAEFYNEVAAIPGGHPTAAVAHLLGVDRSVASRRIRRCRDLGFIPPYRRR